jgi:hypothetical protein
MTGETRFEPANVNVRIKISALWTSMLFVFAYVDLFSLYRADFRADLEAGEVGGFTVNQSFLLGTTVYVVIPSLMVFCALICDHESTESRTSRWASSMRSRSSPARSASGTTTSSAARSRSFCSRPSSTTPGPGRKKLHQPARADEKPQRTTSKPPLCNALRLEHQHREDATIASAGDVCEMAQSPPHAGG